MKKALSLIVLALALFAAPAHADIFGNEDRQRMKASSLYEEGATLSAPFVDSGTILDYVTAILGYLSPRAGTFYDVEQEEFTTLLSATIYTLPDTGVAFGVGMTDTDGVVGSVEYNVGTHIPADDVPVLSLFEYLYVGYAAGARSLDEDGSESWEFAHGPTLIFKTTF